ncbi:MAG: hypothetical protein E6H06_05630 [Bacteroidetes bacterium]|nr:MAG: hypothetical protein E6H06_05630 [Bacteroidota bacterium]
MMTDQNRFKKHSKLGKKTMDDKTPGLPDFYASVKRIECLLEEILFRQIAYNSLSQEEATEAFKGALKNVNKSMQESISNFPSAE